MEPGGICTRSPAWQCYLKTHPDTDNPALNGLVMIGMMYVTDGDKAAVQR